MLAGRNIISCIFNRMSCRISYPVAVMLNILFFYKLDASGKGGQIATQC